MIPILTVKQGIENWGNEKVLIGPEWLPVVKGWALQSQKSQSLCGFQANPAFGTRTDDKGATVRGGAFFYVREGGR